MTEEKKEVAVIEKDEKTRGFELAQRQAAALAGSSMVPKQFQGKENIGNVLIAMELAERMQCSVFALMQAMFVVYGRPGLEGKFIAALINQSGLYEPLQYEIIGSGKTGKGIDRPDKVRAFAKHKTTGEMIYGPWVTWDMVTLNGWDKPKGDQVSKWQTLPELMFFYRAAAYFGRTRCPEVMQGMLIKEEAEELPPPPSKLAPIETVEPAPGVDPYQVKDAPAKEPEKVDDADTAPTTESPLAPWNDKDPIQCRAAKREVFVQTCVSKCNQNETCEAFANYQNEHEKR